MSEFSIYFQIGLKHVLNTNSLDHILFLIALLIPFSFSDWKKTIWLVSLFTIGHTTSLFLSMFQIIKINSNLIEFLIPVTVLITAIQHLFSGGKTNKKDTNKFLMLMPLFFGIIHGLGFSNYFKTLTSDKIINNIFTLFSFSVGIEAAQIFVVIIALILFSLIQSVFKLSKRDWILIMASFIIGLVIPMIVERKINF